MKRGIVSKREGIQLPNNEFIKKMKREIQILRYIGS